jgi:hypothetical protein
MVCKEPLEILVLPESLVVMEVVTAQIQAQVVTQETLCVLLKVDRVVTAVLLVIIMEMLVMIAQVVHLAEQVELLVSLPQMDSPDKMV